MCEELQKGDRVKLLAMPNDGHPVEPGIEGTCTGVGKTPWEKVYYMQWDDGRTLSLLVGTDRWEKLTVTNPPKVS